MFLSYLKEENKERFLKLCVHAALSNGVFAKEEKEILETYCQEMNLPVQVPDIEEPLEVLLKDISENTSETEKKIIVLETLGLIKSDGVYDEQERMFMKKFVNAIDINEELFSKINSLLDIYSVVFQELYKTVIE
ncbi:MAG: hypothetical protein PUG48_01290 [Clostridia bacterium]|nr:hypothetical protein [Clostridia bacterium]